jgi:23S rRNA pseudouridine1911/1915/1917 synthase
LSEQALTGYWLQGQVFRIQSLAELWQHWHHNRDGELQQALSNGWVNIDGQVLSADTGQEVFPGQRFAFFLPGHQEGETDCRWQLLWENPELLLVHKPAGLPVSRTTRNLFDTLISRVRRETRYDEAHLLHRLDAETSGLMLLAKNSHVDRKWKKRLDRLLVRKDYLALVSGRPQWQQYHCETLLAERPDSPIRSRIFVVDETLMQTLPQTYGTARNSITDFKCLASYETANGWQSIIHCHLGTGRRHQIRSQLAWLGLPIVGDKIYSHEGYFYLKRFQQPLDNTDVIRLGADHQLLHAWEAELCLYGESICLRDDLIPASWPDWARAVLSSADFSGSPGAACDIH